jgi:hypothetical protein
LKLEGNTTDIRLTKTAGPESGSLHFDGELGALLATGGAITIEPLAGTLHFDGEALDISTFRWSRVIESDTLWTPVA